MGKYLTAFVMIALGLSLRAQEKGKAASLEKAYQKCNEPIFKSFANELELKIVPPPAGAVCPQIVRQH